jgi:hypothetical protein
VEAEQAALAAAMAPEAPAARAAPEGVRLTRRGGRLILSGTGVDDALEADLTAWLAARGAG